MGSLVACESSPAPTGTASSSTANATSVAASSASAAPSSVARSSPELTVSKPKDVAATAESEVGTLPEGVGLAVGTEAPDFELPGIDGEKVRLHALLEKSKVLLVFYRGGW